ncbi:MAG: hypothetical protein IH609_20425 [Dehalococcoidia bacterium]|nr:hypothetical protein [Dehalococcoidia bacterium]
MPETPIPPQLLDDVIERRVSITPSMGEVAALARLAFDCGGIAVAGPDGPTGDRMRARFAETIMGGRRRGPLALFSIGIGAQGLQRKLAAAALAATVVGGATSYSTGVSPLEAIDGVVGFVRSVVVNVMPNDGGRSGGVATPEASPSPSPSPPPTGTPSPTAQGSPAPVATPPPGEGTQAPAPASAQGQPAAPQATPASGQIGDAATPEPTHTGTPTPTPIAGTPTPSEDDEPAAAGTVTVEHTVTPSPSPSPSATPDGDAEPGDDEDDHRLGSGEDRGAEEDDK